MMLFANYWGIFYLIMQRIINCSIKTLFFISMLINDISANEEVQLSRSICRDTPLQNLQIVNYHKIYNYFCISEILENSATENFTTNLLITYPTENVYKKFREFKDKQNGTYKYDKRYFSSIAKKNDIKEEKYTNKYYMMNSESRGSSTNGFAKALGDVLHEYMKHN